MRTAVRQFEAQAIAATGAESGKGKLPQALRANPQTCGKQSCRGNHPRNAPTGQRRFGMRLVDSVHDLARFQARFLNIPFQLAAEFSHSILDLLSENPSGARFRFMDRVREICHPRTNVVSDLLRRIFQYQLIERDQCERRVARLDPYAVARSNFRD
jgi:hypothetical protein